MKPRVKCKIIDLIVTFLAENLIKVMIFSIFLLILGARCIVAHLGDIRFMGNARFTVSLYVTFVDLAKEILTILHHF